MKMSCHLMWTLNGVVSAHEIILIIAGAPASTLQEVAAKRLMPLYRIQTDGEQKAALNDPARIREMNASEQADQASKVVQSMSKLICAGNIRTGAGEICLLTVWHPA